MFPEEKTTWGKENKLVTPMFSGGKTVNLWVGICDEGTKENPK